LKKNARNVKTDSAIGEWRGRGEKEKQGQQKDAQEANQTPSSGTKVKQGRKKHDNRT
jgi:hypothetical protein